MLNDKAEGIPVASDEWHVAACMIAMVSTAFYVTNKEARTVRSIIHRKYGNAPLFPAIVPRCIKVTS